MRLLPCIAALLFVGATATSAHAVRYRMLGSLPGYCQTPVIVDGSTLYGTYHAAVFRMNTDGTGFEGLHSFGETIIVTPVMQIGSTLYGTTPLVDKSTIFKLNTDGSDFETLHMFTNGFTSTTNPGSALVSDGTSLYGTAGGARSVSTPGAIFRIGTDGTGFQILHSFLDSEAAPGSVLLSGTTLYGIARGGSHLNGAIFRMNTDGSSYQIVREFGESDSTGLAGVHALSGDTIYGVTKGFYGVGVNGVRDNGTIFRMNTDGTDFQVLHTFSGPDGRYPNGVIMHGEKLYGTTENGGETERGTVYEMNLDGSGFRTLHSFVGSLVDGRAPNAELTLSGDTLYGTTSKGPGSPYGASGTVFALELTPEPTEVIARTHFDEPPLGAVAYSPAAGSNELGFTTTHWYVPNGVNPFVGVDLVGGARVLSHRSLHAITTTDAVDLQGWTQARVSVDLRVSNTEFESGDFLHIYASDGVQTLDLFLAQGLATGGDFLENQIEHGLVTVSADIPDNWSTARLVIDSWSNSTSGSERYDFDNVVFLGLPATTPTPGDLNGDGKADLTDLAIVVDNFGLAPGATAAEGDLNGDGRVGVADVARMQSLLEMPTASAAPVPEPSALAMAFAAVVAAPLASRIAGRVRGIRHRLASRCQRTRSERHTSLERLELRCVMDLSDGLIGYWPFDGNAEDLSGGNRHLNLFGGANFGSGRIGQALQLSGASSQYAARTVDDQILDFGGSDFTVGIWARYNNANSEQLLVEKFQGSNGPGWTLTKLANNVLHFWADPSVRMYSNPLAIGSNTWHHFAVRRQGSRFDLFFNGDLVTTANHANPVPDTTFPLLVGRRNAGHFGHSFPMNGSLDDLAIWNRALADSEVVGLYNNGAGSAPLSPLCQACGDFYEVIEDATLVVPAALGVLANDAAQVGESLTITDFGTAAHGTVSLAADGSFTYAPYANFFGSDTFTYTVESNVRPPRNAAVTIAVLPQPDLPIAVDEAYEIRTGSVLSIAAAGVLTNDANVDASVLTVCVRSPPAHGTLVLTDEGAFTYRPVAGFVGTDSFAYRACNAAGQSNWATVRIDVAPALVPDTALRLTTEFLGGIGLVAPRDDGGFYFAESFDGSKDFDPGPDEVRLQSAGDRDTVIARYAADGTLVWLRQIGGEGSETPRGMTVDRDGNVYVKGSLGSTTAHFGDTLVETENPSLLLVKLDANGNFSWIITPQGEENSRALAVDDSPDDRGEWTVFTVPLEPAPSLDSIPYFSQLNAETGAIVELKTFASEGPNDRYVMTDVFVDDRGNITTTGTFYWYFTADFIIEGTDVVRFSPDLELSWSAQFPGFAVQQRQQVVVDGEGNTYVEASFHGAVGFTSDPADDIESSGLGYNSYVAALDDDGNWRWTAVLRANDLAAATIGLAVDTAGNVFTAGSFNGEGSFGDTSMESAGDADVYLAYIDRAAGEIAGIWRVGGVGRDVSGSVAVDAAGNAFVQLSVQGAEADSPRLPTGEYALTFRRSSSETPGDANGDGRVDRVDLAIVALNFGTIENAGRADGDLNADGRVSLADVAFVQRNFDFTAPAAGALVAAASARRTAVASAIAARFRRPLAATESTLAIESPPVVESSHGSRRGAARDQSRWRKAVDQTIPASVSASNLSKLRIATVGRRAQTHSIVARIAHARDASARSEDLSEPIFSPEVVRNETGRRVQRR